MALPLKSLIWFAIVFVGSIGVCESKLDDYLQKQCHITDDVCTRNFFGKITPAVQIGLVDLGIPPVDPLRMSNITADVLGMVQFTLVDGEATGIKDCEYVDVTSHIERQLATMHISCNIVFNGKFKAHSSNPTVQEILGKSLNEEGTAKLTLRDLNLFFEFHYFARLSDSGELYLRSKHKEIKHHYTYNGPMMLEFESLLSDNPRANNFVANFLDENSSFVKATIGEAYVVKIMEFYYEFNRKFFDTVPAGKYYYKEDLMPFALKNKSTR